MMKKTLFALFFLLSGMLNSSAQKTYALLMGISTYSDNSVTLPNANRNAKDLKMVLDNQGVISSLITSKYVTPANIEQKINALVKIAKPEDRVIVYFAGHGAPNAVQVYDMSLFTYQRLFSLIKPCRAHQIIFWYDTCHSGGAGNILRDTPLSDKHPNITFFSSSREDEYSIYDINLIAHGYFTKALVKGLRGLADTNNDKQITVLELFKYVHGDVTNRIKVNDPGYGQQHPQLFCDPSMYNIVLAKWPSK